VRKCVRMRSGDAVDFQACGQNVKTIMATRNLTLPKGLIITGRGGT
jgi:hypothetical protein